MNLTTRLNDALRAMIKKRRERNAMTNIDTDTPKDMGKTRRRDEPIPKTTHTIRNEHGDQVCAECSGEIVVVNAKGTRACWECGTEIVD